MFIKQIDRQSMMCIYGERSSLQREGILSHASTWMNLEDMLLSEKSQSQNNQYESQNSNTMWSYLCEVLE